MDEIYTLQEVADKMKVSVQTVTKLVKSGKMKSSLIGRQYRITETFLNEFLNGIFGDMPVEQTRAINPTEKVNRKPNIGRSLKSQEVATPSIEVSPQVETFNNTGAMPVDTLGKMLEQNKPIIEPLELILKLKADGMAYPAIAEHLNSEGLKTSRGFDWTKDIICNELRKLKKLTNG